MAFVDTQVRPQGEQVDAKLSALVRECGYGRANDYTDCVLGRAYTKLTGRSLQEDGGNSVDEPKRPWVSRAAQAFGVPLAAAGVAELMCLKGVPPSSIADWLESQGL